MPDAIVAGGRAGATCGRLAAIALLAGVGCLPRALVDRAPPDTIPTVVRESEVVVTLGFPGTWRWRMVVAGPDRYAWTVYTTGEPTHYLFDGTVVRSYIGGALTSEDATPAAPLRSHARFMALTRIDGLDAPGVRVRELAPSERPADTPAALEATFADTGDRYVVGFDDARRVRSVEGPVALAPFGRPVLRVVLADYRRVDGHQVPHRASWTLDGAPLAEERTRAVCVVSPSLTAAAFRTPATLPECVATD